MQNQCIYHHMCEILPVLLNHGHPEKDLLPILDKETSMIVIKLTKQIYIEKLLY